MPYGVAGVEVKAAVKKAATWGTAVACGASDGILILPTTIKKSAPVDVDDSLGTFYSKDGLLGAIKVEGDLPAYLRYDSLNVLIGMAMGVTGAPAQQGGTTAYAFTYKVDTDIDGHFVTWAQYLKNYIEEIASLKIIGFTIKGEVGKALQIIFHTIGINKTYNTSSGTNTTTTFGNVTFPEVANRVPFSQGVFRMNGQSAGALASPADKIYPSSFELSFKRKLTGVYDGQNRFTSGSNTQELIDEPTNDGVPEITLKLTFPRNTGLTWLTILGGDTRQKADIVFTGGLIAGSYYRSFTLQFPHLQLADDDPADAAGIIQEPLEFKVHGASAAPTGMTGCTEAFWITGINQRTTDPLA
jgi:hypothetical protein